MEFRDATLEDHPLVAEPHHVSKVSTNEEGPRYWIVVIPMAYGQFRIQMWHEFQRGMQWPDIFSLM